MKKILLVGGGGFAGRHLSNALSGSGHQVFTADLPIVAKENPAIIPIDLLNKESLKKALLHVRPDVIFHLAAQSMVPKSWQSPELTAEINIVGSVNMFMAAAEYVPECRFIFIGSGEEYGIGCDMQHPFTENTICNPQNPYAVTKFTAGMILEKLALRNGVDFVHLRPFNHYGPEQRTGFVISDFCSQIAEIEAGLRHPEMLTGCLDAQRDFLFVQDVINAYCLFADCREHKFTTYNICSGIACAIQNILDILLSFSTENIHVEIDPARYRKPENPVLFASAKRLTDEFNWHPETDLKNGLLKTLDFWRKKYKR